MSGVKIKILMETEDVDPVTLTPDRVVIGWAELDPGAAMNKSSVFMLRQLPDIMRDMAEQLESGMTTGPDEAHWLGGPDDPVDGGS